MPRLKHPPVSRQKCTETRLISNSNNSAALRAERASRHGSFSFLPTANIASEGSLSLFASSLGAPFVPAFCNEC